MSREWKPGDAVTATVNGRPNVRLIAGWSKHDPQLRWGELSTRWADGDDDECWFMPFQVTDHRRLVVVDPESESDAEAIVKAFVAAGVWRVIPVEVEDSHAHRREQVQAALREFANPTPPKPEEPTGLGAVVEDADGDRWVLYTSPDSTAPWCDGSTSCEWDEFDAVRVLSKGVES